MLNHYIFWKAIQLKVMKKSFVQTLKLQSINQKRKYEIESQTHSNLIKFIIWIGCKSILSIEIDK